MVSIVMTKINSWRYKLHWKGECKGRKL